MKNQNNQPQSKRNNSKVITILLAVMLVITSIGGYLVIGKSSPTANQKATIVSTNGIEIIKANIDKPTFFKYEVNGKPMEVVAVKDANGIIRVAYNTCQVCHDSGKGYYKAEGSFLICQNCKNAFKYNEVGVSKGGCNPIPIEGKIDEVDKIVIPDSALVKDAPLFDKWKF